MKSFSLGFIDIDPSVAKTKIRDVKGDVNSVFALKPQ